MSSLAEENKSAECTSFGPNPDTERAVPGCLDLSKDGTKLCYPSGNVVVIRDTRQMSSMDVYTEHNARVTVARFAPSGNYVASGDAKGKMRVWASNMPSHNLKKEHYGISEMRDIAWGPEGKRIAMCGKGQPGKMQKVVTWDHGNALGDMGSGSTKVILSIAFRPGRPYRVATASEDQKVNFFEGPPFKYKSAASHTNFVNCVRFSPDGEHCVSVGSDRLIKIYNGKTCEGTSDITCNGKDDTHSGSIYSCIFDNTSSTNLFTASADKTVKLWDLSTGKVVSTKTFGNGVGDMQQAVTSAENVHMSISLDGSLNVFDPRDGKPGAHTVIQGHQSFVTRMTASSDHMFTTDNYGLTYSWDYSSFGTPAKIDGAKALGSWKSNKSLDMAISQDRCCTIQNSGDVMFFNTSTGSYNDKETVALKGGPTKVVMSPTDKSVSVVLTSSNNQLNLLNAGTVAHKLPLRYEPKCFAFAPNGKEIAVGGDDGKVHCVTVSDDGKKLEKSDSDFMAKSCNQDINVLAFSPDGKYLASADGSRDIKIIDAEKKEIVVQRRLKAHTSRVTTVAWSEDSQYMASGSIDTNLIVWKPLEKKKLKIMNVHAGPIYSVLWKDAKTVVTAGHDGVIKLHNMEGRLP